MLSKIIRPIVRGSIRYPAASVLGIVAFLVTVPLVWAHFTALSQTATTKPVAAAKPKVSQPAAKPITPAPQPTPVVQAPASKPVAPTRKVTPQPTRTAAAPAAVAATATAPGKSVSSLNLAPSTSASTSTSSTSSSSSSSTASSSTPPPTNSSATYTSLNWAGYMASGATYTAVSGGWVIPTPAPNGSSNSADASWIGIGGVNTQDLIQVGTENTVDASGKISSAVFYELLPAAPVYPTNIIVSSGDSMFATLTETSPGVWKITITDNTTSQSFTTSVSYTSSHSSAEWIEEDPSYSNGTLVPLDFFGSVPFSGGTTTASGSIVSITESGASSINLVTQAGVTRVQTSVVGSTGKTFTTTRTSN